MPATEEASDSDCLFRALSTNTLQFFQAIRMWIKSAHVQYKCMDCKSGFKLISALPPLTSAAKGYGVCDFGRYSDIQLRKTTDPDELPIVT